MNTYGHLFRLIDKIIPKLRFDSMTLVNSYGQRRRIHLYHQPRNTKARGTVHHYSLATCYYEDGKNKKKVLQSVGELTDVEVGQYRLVLKALNGQIDIKSLSDLESLIVKDEKNYFDVLVMDALWQRLGLDKIFNRTSSDKKKITTEQVAKILTLNRLLKPAAKVKTVAWLQSTLLGKIMGIEEDAYDKNKVFRELIAIHKNKSDLEQAFWKFSEQHCGKCEAYYFDGSTSWFEGTKCLLAEADLEKTRGFFPKVIGLMLITDNRGFPVAWEIVNGHSKDTSCLKDFVKRIAKDFGIQKITYCFDRGVASVANFDFVEEHESKFISAIRDNQIKDVLYLEKFKLTRIKITEHLCETEPSASAAQSSEETAKPLRRKVLDFDGFLSFDNNIFFKDLGVVSAKRYVASFNYELFIKESQNRQRRLEQVLLDINEKNIEIALAKKDRDYNVTERDLLEIFAKQGVRDFFDYTLLPFTTAKKAQSFKIECQIKRHKIIEASLTDGLLIYITDHVELKNSKEPVEGFKLSAYDIVAHYKGKHVVENAFREMKSFLELRPFFVWTEEHVKAHYDIAIIACFINNYIAVQLRDLGLSIRDFYARLDKAARAAQIAAPSGLEIFKLKPIDTQMKRYLDQLDIAHTYSPTVHKHHGIFQ